jgi:hypothetical protein
VGEDEEEANKEWFRCINKYLHISFHVFSLTTSKYFFFLFLLSAFCTAFEPDLGGEESPDRDLVGESRSPD